MAEQGYNVLIVEREQRFKDRVRGEFLFPLDVEETKRLGIYDALMQAGGHHPRYWFRDARVLRRELTTIT
jgi:menaquinone-9 beta-reductase